MSKSYIKINNLSLDYYIYSNRKSLKTTILHSLFKLFSSKEKEFKVQRALESIQVNFESGDRVALIGNNGSGKSTLLRVLSKIYPPTAGFIEINGKSTSILDINIGLNPESTGYENVVLMGVLHHKTKTQMKQKFHDIEQFTELGHHLKKPIKTYSSGMRLRLAFAIATCMESDILIIDEVIGVGDSAFMIKAQKRMHELVHKSQILVLASHSTQILKQFCNKAMVLDQGKCIFFGNLDEGLELHAKSGRLS